MSWLASFGVAVAMFFGSMFGLSHTSPSTAAPMQESAPGISPTSSAQAPQSSPTNSVPPSPISAAQSASEQALMRQVGCTDQNSCVSACMQQGMTQACEQLRALMAGQVSQGRSSAAYTTGSPSGPNAPQSDVAYVGNGTAANASELPDCSSNNALFNTSPVALTDLAGIEPLGHMNGEHILPNQADHVYLLAKPSESSATVYAPGDATLLQVNEQVGIAGADQGTNSVKLYFSPCKSVMFALQINTLSPQLQRALSSVKSVGTQAGATVQNTVYGPLNVSIKSGEVLGTIVNTGGVGGQADFAAADVRTSPLQFIDQSEATGMLANSYQHAVCPLDYFDNSLRSTLSSLLTIKNAGSNGILACGSTMQDKAGTAQGNWYDKTGGAPAYQGIDESSLLAIVHSNLDPSRGEVSVGTDLVPSSYLGTQLIFQPQNSGYINREPSQITLDGNVYCFDGPMGAGGKGAEGHIDIRLDSATRLEADYGTGACATSPTLSSTVTYDR